MVAYGSNCRSQNMLDKHVVITTTAAGFLPK